MNFIVRKLFKFYLRDFKKISTLDVQEFAAGLEKLKKKLPKSSAPSKRIKRKMDVKTRSVNGGIYYVAKDKTNRSNKKVLFIHGGGFFLEALPPHWKLCQSLAEDTGCEIIFPQYPMVPETTAKASHDMLMEVYKEFIKGSRSEDLTIIGDSAGGTLALSVTMLARDRGMKLANEIVLISPGFMISDMTEKERRRAEYIRKHDYMLGQFPIEKISEMWLGKLGTENYRESVAKVSLKDFPHITMFSGTHDILNIPARRFAARLKKENHPFSYYERKGGAHDYALLKKNRKEYDVIVSKIKGL